MTATPGGAMGDLLNGMAYGKEPITEGAALLRGFARAEVPRLLAALRDVTEAAPFRHMVTRGGYTMSVAMTSCGTVGWVTDRSGYRYDRVDPATGRFWPPMPEPFKALAARAAAECGFPDFEPDACLVNEYRPGARLSLHQDADELDFTQPIVSVSLGLPALFLFGGTHRGDRPGRLRLESGDVAAWGGPSRLAFHGVEPLSEGIDPLTGSCRINLTFRRAR
jgi:alkylated DNA repair protein (DNA oxidative demethylase)